MTATRGIVASVVAIAIIAAAIGVFVWQTSGSDCPEPYNAATSYLTDEQVTFNGRVWKATQTTTSENPTVRGGTWVDAGTC